MGQEQSWYFYSGSFPDKAEAIHHDCGPGLLCARTGAMLFQISANVYGNTVQRLCHKCCRVSITPVSRPAGGRDLPFALKMALGLRLRLPLTIENRGPVLFLETHTFWQGRGPERQRGGMSCSAESNIQRITQEYYDRSVVTPAYKRHPSCQQAWGNGLEKGNGTSISLSLCL